MDPYATRTLIVWSNASPAHMMQGRSRRKGQGWKGQHGRVWRWRVWQGREEPRRCERRWCQERGRLEARKDQETGSKKQLLNGKRWSDCRASSCRYESSHHRCTSQAMIAMCTQDICTSFRGRIRMVTGSPISRLSEPIRLAGSLVSDQWSAAHALLYRQAADAIVSPPHCCHSIVSMILSIP